MDVAASRGLATTLEMWPSGFDEVISLVSEAEVLSDVPVLVTPALDSIGSDGAVMAAAIRKAADELESFTLGLDSSFDIAQAVADVRSFRGTDNDPELDKRLRRLRELVETYTSSDVETARVMSQLLAGDDVRFRDISDVEAAMAELERFNHLEATGAISSNDPLIDDALRDLRTALADHADTDEQANQLLYALVDRGDNPASTRAVMASVLTGWSSDVVHVAHANNLDYDIADGLIKLDRVDIFDLVRGFDDFSTFIGNQVSARPPVGMSSVTSGTSAALDVAAERVDDLAAGLGQRATDVTLSVPSSPAWGWAAGASWNPVSSLRQRIGWGIANAPELAEAATYRGAASTLSGTAAAQDVTGKVVGPVVSSIDIVWSTQDAWSSSEDEPREDRIAHSLDAAGEAVFENAGGAMGGYMGQTMCGAGPWAIPCAVGGAEVGSRMGDEAWEMTVDLIRLPIDKDGFNVLDSTDHRSLFDRTIDLFTPQLPWD